jgi:hypothetical protein
MGPVPGRNRRLESAISIFLLVILFLIGLGVFVRQFDGDVSRFGIDTTIAGPSAQQTKAGTQGPALESLSPSGFKELSAIEIYHPENLYEKINGKAPLYLESGFVELLARRFVSEADESLWMELFVYDMATMRNAFSIFSVQRRADVDILSLFDTSFGYRTDNSLYFIHGKYYVELLGSAKSVELFKAIIEVAQKTMDRLDAGGAAEITELDLFGGDKRIEGSCKLYLRNAFGFEGLTDVFTYSYRFGDESVTAFLIKRGDPQDARAVASSYYNFLIDNEATAKSTASQTLRDIGAKVLDFYGTTEIVFAIGPFVGGIHEAESQESAEELVLMLVDRLSEATKAEK